MEKIVAYCGIKCHKCSVYRASKIKNINKKRKKARKLSEKGYPLEASDINCPGCRATDKDVPPFVLKCRIRGCVRYNNLEHCFQCGRFLCKKMYRNSNIYDIPLA